MRFFTAEVVPHNQTLFLNDQRVQGMPGPSDVAVFQDSDTYDMGQIYGLASGAGGGFLIGTNAHVIFNAAYPVASASTDNLWLMPGSTLGSLNGQGVIDAQTMTIMAGATFDAGTLIGAAPIPYQPYTYNIGNIWNAGGDLVDLSKGELTVGMPGFVQTGGFFGAESNVSDGQGNNWIMLGDVHQGDYVPKIIESIWNSTPNAQDGFFVNLGSPGFVDNLVSDLSLSSYQDGVNQKYAGSIMPDTHNLGSFQEAIGFVVGGKIVDCTFVSMRVI